MLRVCTILLALAPCVAHAEEFAGSFTGKHTHQEPMPLGENRMVLGLTATGTNKDTGANGFMDGARVMWSAMSLLDKGSGPEGGVLTMVGKDGVVTATYRGTLTTTMEQGGQPRTTATGTWQTLSGTGPFADYKGGGTYSLQMTSKTDFIGEWKGSMSRDPAATSSTE